MADETNVMTSTAARVAMSHRPMISRSSHSALFTRGIP